jgi:DNA-binding IclR family transcriptional regulator
LQRPVKYSIGPDGLTPLHAISGGKCILAFMPDEEFEEYLNRVDLSPITAYTITDRDVLKKELEHVRPSWFAYGQKEYYEGVCGIAAPVFNIYGFLAGSILITMEAVRFNLRHKAFIKPVLRDVARKLSRHLGFGGGYGGRGNPEGGDMIVVQPSGRKGGLSDGKCKRQQKEA